MQVHALHFIQTVHALHACLKSVLGWGFAQPRPQLVHVRHYLHLNGFLLPHLIPPESVLTFLSASSSSIPLSLSLTLSTFSGDPLDAVSHAGW